MERLAAVERGAISLLCRIPNGLEFIGCVVASWIAMLEASFFFLIQVLPETMKEATKDILPWPLFDLGFGCMASAETGAPVEVSRCCPNEDLAITLLEGLPEGWTLV